GFELAGAGTLKVNIEDNGIGLENTRKFSRNSKHTSLGIETTIKRLSIICRQNHQQFNIAYENCFPGAENPGTRIAFCFPYSTDN
ncbi:MAG: hypothetical protein K8R53_05960, partial [Bacteroidales bacterium]|nr:hypothetical protein [Bacteroidales bacterium]